MKSFYIIALFLVCAFSSLFATDYPAFSTGGFYELPDTGRKAYSMNMAWRFLKGDSEAQVWNKDFDDSGWEVVSLPHGIEYLPVEASGKYSMP